MQIEKLQSIFKRAVSTKNIHEAVLLVENASGSFSYTGEHGGKKKDSPLLLASITKLFTTACILIMQEQGKLSLQDDLLKYFNDDEVKGLHSYKGQDYTSKLKLSSLLFQTSGLPDIFEEGKNPLKKQVIEADMSVHFNEIVALTKTTPAHFVPDSKQQAHYADINFDLLGEIIERVMEMPLHQAYEQLLFLPLGLTNTYLPIADADIVPLIYYKNVAIHRPKYLKCCRASGGAISTAEELMIFIKAFFQGRLFKQEIFKQLEHYKKLQMSMFPLAYGGGYMRITLKSPLTLFMGKGELIGHSGSTGSFAYYYPEKDIFLVGDVNQLTNPSLPVKLMMQIASAYR